VKTKRVIPFNLSTSLHFTMTEGDSLTKKIAPEPAPDQDNIRESVVTFSNVNPADNDNFRESMVTFSDVNTGDTACSFGSSVDTTRTIVVDATEHLEASRGRISSGKLIPGVKDVTQGVQDAVRSAKDCVRIFRVDNEIFEVNQEQLDRVRMSKCELEGVCGMRVVGRLTAQGHREEILHLLIQIVLRSFFLVF
jgi:hypothetical protein